MSNNYRGYFGPIGDWDKDSLKRWFLNDLQKSFVVELPKKSLPRSRFDIYEWIIINTKQGECHCLNLYIWNGATEDTARFYFKYEDDALLFRLRWENG